MTAVCEKGECAKLRTNRIVIKEFDTGRDMVKKTNRKEISRTVDWGGRQIKLVLQFPEESREECRIREEIRAIMAAELLRQIKETGRNRR